MTDLTTLRRELDGLEFDHAVELEREILNGLCLGLSSCLIPQAHLHRKLGHQLRAYNPWTDREGCDVVGF